MYSSCMTIGAGVLVFLLLLGTLRAETLRVDEVYSGPQKLTARNLGASFMLPENWDAQLQSPQGPLVLQSRDDASRIMFEANVSVIGNPAVLLGEKKAYYGLELVSPTQIKQLRPSVLYRFYRLQGSQAFSQALVYVVSGSQGRAILLYGFTTPGALIDMRRMMLSLANSLSFTAIKALPHQMTSLYLKLASGHFVFYARRGSFSEKRELWLCRDGSARLKGGYTMANETSRKTIARNGVWRLEGDRLALDLEGEIRERYRITQENNTLFFDRAQTFRLPNHVCK